MTLQQAYQTNYQKQFSALVAEDEILYRFYGARLSRAEKAMVEQSGEIEAAIQIIEAVIR